jgi:VAD1 Analog of StAR-related lipid transfer domain/GRAM domain
LTHDSHAGYLTHSSPLITTTTVDESASTSQPEQFPTLPPERPEHSPALSASNPPSITHSPSLPANNSTPALSSPTLFDRANTLGLPSNSRSARRKSISSSIRGISPGRKLREAFQPGKSTRSPKTSPDRGSSRGKGGGEQTAEVITHEARPDTGTKKAPPPPVKIVGTKTEPLSPNVPHPALPSLNTKDRPQTPPSAGVSAPLTTVTPPTPVDARARTQKSPTRTPEPSARSNEASNILVSPSGNMISHRRVRSDSGSLHQPSKLSNAISAPLTPTIEESKTPSAKSDSRTVTQGSGFFSSWVSAAQNAANTISNTLNTQNRSRSGTEDTEPEKPISATRETVVKDPMIVEPNPSRKRLAVETLGAGDLKLSHLGIGTEAKENGTVRPDMMEARKDSTIRRDEAAAKIEDMLAKRAVSAAYEKPPEDSSKTPMAELADPMNSVRPSSTINSTMSNELQTTPNGSIFEGDTGSVKRNNSVRSRLKDRRKRGSSTATGASTVGTLLAASASSLVNPAAAPKLTGFAIAPKSRNRTFHQLFRSVPEDDFLIEDYSCALQKEILLAGRIYISEGHICFSSNILGWVTTLVISFEEVMAIERETTAMVFPNAIAVQTLHARHTFRSLLSREATFDLIVGIWKASHPAAFKKSISGNQTEEETAPTIDKAAEIESDSEEGSEDEDEIYDEDEEDEGAGSFVEAGSCAGSETLDGSHAVARKPSAMNGGIASTVMPYASTAGDAQAAEKALAAASAATVDFPGPSVHTPTDCTDSATHYDKVLKDESIPAPLGKIYSMLFGPTSGIFLTKYLIDEQKVTELQYEDDKKGLGEQNKSRSYSYIKPLYGAIGPKQTKCLTTESLDAFDLERSVSVTCTTQTPDVPSGSVFSVKTRYCLSWAAGNATRLQMNCTVEWTGKSWLKGEISVLPRNPVTNPLSRRPD